MAQETIIVLTDDLDGGDADETVTFALDGKAYQIDLNKKNAAALRRTFKRFIDGGRAAGRASTGGRGRGSSSGRTLFSQLDEDEKTRFRKWAKLPNARRIGDARVKEWIDSGRP
jgi:hypothetical protein